MADKSAIEWTDATWTPIRARNKVTGAVGWHCEHATTGCEFCFAEGFNKRLGTGLPFKPGHRKDIELFLDEKMLLAPLKWKRPRMVFVCSMTDLFASFVPDEWIDKIFAIMALAPQHTFQVLTKRAERMKKWLAPFDQRRADSLGAKVLKLGYSGPLESLSWPLPNVWLGVSAERQKEADERIPHLLATPAAVRFISAEPLLGPIDLTGTRLDWVIVGGESGRGARPMSIQWARELRDQCLAAEVSFFFKQWGAWRPAGLHQSGNPGRFAFGDYEHDRAVMVQVDAYPRHFTSFGARSIMERVGKKAAGRLLDGVEYNGMPQVAA